MNTRLLSCSQKVENSMEEQIPWFLYQKEREREREIYIRVDVIHNYEMRMGEAQNSLSGLSKTTGIGMNIINFDYFDLFAALG